MSLPILVRDGLTSRGFCWPSKSNLLGWPDGGLCALRWDRTDHGGISVVARLGTKGRRGLNLTASPDRTRAAVTSSEDHKNLARLALYQLNDAPSSVKKSAFSTRRDVRRWDDVLGGGPGAVLR